jgi:small GTP-binding protein
MEKKLMKKVCLLGDGAVGKTSLIRKFVFDRFDDRYIMTFGTKVSKKNITLVRNDTQYNLTFLIWDILGQRVHDSLHATYYSGAGGAFMVCDATRLDTLQHMDEWVTVFKKVNKDAPIVLLGNKADLVDQAQFGVKELAEIAAKYAAPHHMTSARTGAFVEESFLELGNLIIDAHLKTGGPEE